MTEHRLYCEENGIRVDKYIADAEIGLSRSAAVGLIENGGVTVNGQHVNKKAKLKHGDTISVSIPDPIPYEAKAEDIPIEIVYEDNDLLVVNKPRLATTKVRLSTLCSIIAETACPASTA